MILGFLIFGCLVVVGLEAPHQENLGRVSDLENGWIQTLLREIVKSQSFGYPTSHSKSSTYYFVWV